LITVSGIGPKIALRLLSAISPELLVSHILNGNLAQLTALKGIGKKTAEVMVASLRAPLSKLNLGSTDSIPGTQGQNKALADAVLALVTLGVKESPAQSSAEKASQRLGKEASTSQLITEALTLL
jgi:Holliday junction DNA helicase RuvA